jgi:hypothetical protein
MLTCAGKLSKQRLLFSRAPRSGRECAAGAERRREEEEEMGAARRREEEEERLRKNATIQAPAVVRQESATGVGW